MSTNEFRAITGQVFHGTLQSKVVGNIRPTKLWEGRGTYLEPSRALVLSFPSSSTPKVPVLDHFRRESFDPSSPWVLVERGNIKGRGGGKDCARAVVRSRNRLEGIGPRSQGLLINRTAVEAKRCAHVIFSTGYVSYR